MCAATAVAVWTAATRPLSLGHRPWARPGGCGDADEFIMLGVAEILKGGMIL